MATKRILIVDDHPIVRMSLAIILRKIPELVLVGETDSGKLCLRLARKLKPDLVILDYKLPDISGLEVTRRLLKQNPGIKVLILTAEDHLAAKTWLLDAGVHGFLNKTASLEEINTAINIIFERGHLPQMTHPFPVKTAFRNLTAREAEIMRMMIYGDSLKNIARRLNLDVKTIYDYRRAIYQKMNVRSPIALTVYAWKESIFSLEDVNIYGIIQG